MNYVIHNTIYSFHLLNKHTIEILISLILENSTLFVKGIFCLENFIKNYKSIDFV